MALITKDSGGSGNFEPVPEGTHIARCITVVDIGIQQTPWGGKEKVYLGFEAPGVRVEWKDSDGNDHEGPAIIGSRYTNSINEKAILGQHLVSWRGKQFTDDERQGFDLFAVLGAPCMLSVTHNTKGDRTYANITGIMRLPQGMTAPETEGELIGYTPNDPNMIGNLTKLPEWLQKLCKEGYGAAADSLGQPGLVTDVAPAKHMDPPAAPPDQYFDDDIPF